MAVSKISSMYKWNKISSKATTSAVPSVTIPSPWTEAIIVLRWTYDPIIVKHILNATEFNGALRILEAGNSATPHIEGYIWCNRGQSSLSVDRLNVSNNDYTHDTRLTLTVYYH